MCSIGWDGRNLGVGLLLCFTLYLSKGFLGDVMMTCYEKSEVGLIRWSGCFFFSFGFNVVSGFLGKGRMHLRWVMLWSEL